MPGSSGKRSSAPSRRTRPRTRRRRQLSQRKRKIGLITGCHIRDHFASVGSPRRSRWVWTWAALGLAGLAIAGLGAVFFGSAWDGYIAANRGYLQDTGHPPPATGTVGTQASLAAAMLALGYLSALVASLMRLRRTRGGWMLLRALAALTPIPILWLWLKYFFAFLVNNICSDCNPPQPTIPVVFQFGNNVLTGAAALGLILSVVFVAFAIFTFARTRRMQANLPTR